MTSIRELVRSAASELAAAGVNSPRVDAELLLSHVTGRRRGELGLVGELTGEQESDFQSLVQRRAAREPLQHLTGRAPFRYLELQVGPGVFVPRPETELLVDKVLQYAAGEQVRRVVDLCAGSGALALSIATELPGTDVWAVEIDETAAGWTRRNLAAHLPVQVRLVVADAREVACGPLAQLAGICDVVVSNPPYIPDAAVPRDPEVAAHDPAVALYGGPDGLEVIRALAEQAFRLLRAGGLFVVEHADCQGEPAGVPGLLRAGGWQDVSDQFDLTEAPRFATARRPSGR
ncbi:MAG: peptide chain release factor N(5)-glutamine methyltransferase [Candidatus Nanopelagicales bacterium]